MAAKSIYLIGGRGAGKTTVGRLLAAELGWTFIDVDEQIEGESGCTIVDIFAKHGEFEFRSLEAATLSRLAKMEQHVIATGGGIVLSQINRDHLKKSGTVIWLSASPEVAYQRISSDPSTSRSRPALTENCGLAEMIQVLREREPLYREVANFTIDTTHLSPEGVVSAILAEC